MSDASITCLVVGALLLLAAALSAAYDIARRRVDLTNQKQIDMLIERILSLEGLEAGKLSLRIDALNTDVTTLRADNVAEFAAMKTAFDRFTTRQAVAETIHGVQARQFT